jgi:hypothetical protein
MKTRLALSIATLGLGVALLSSASANAQPIPTLPNWDVRDETIGIGSFFAENWLVTGGGATNTVYVTDLFVPGDNYNIYDNGGLIASTNVADCAADLPDGCSVGGSFYTSDPNAAWHLSQFAHASFIANVGDVITIQAITLPTGFSDSTVAISEAPEASTWAMMLLGFAGLGFAGYRKAKSVAAVA